MLKNITLSLVLFAGLLVLLEVGLRIIQPSRGIFKRNFKREISYQQLDTALEKSWMLNHPELGWVCDANNFARLPSPESKNITYRFNKSGFRSSLEFKDTISDKRKIMLIGDSFMFGLHLDEGQTITARLDSILGETHLFYNISIPGWGIDQMYLAFEKYVDIINPDIVVVMYIDNDIIRTLHSRRGKGTKPSFAIKNGNLIEDIEAPGVLEQFCWTNQISNRLYAEYMERYAVDLSQIMLNEIINSEIEYSRTPIFIHIPHEDQVHENRNVSLFDLGKFVVGTTAEHIDLYDTLSLLTDEDLADIYLPDDGHFTEKGADLVAGLIIHQLDENNQ